MCTNTFSHGTLTFSHITIESVSSKRQASGFSNSHGAWRSKGFLDHSATPGEFTGIAQVIDSASWFGASGIRLPIQISLAKTAPVASIFIPEMTTPASSSRTTRSVGIGRFCFW